ncbi:MAG: arginine--tRNA ligase [Erysipelotrichaceae bacterium]|uniref:arginine--tRNA ligase n=1 Tax=Anaerorhabdus sp. TaxID=1872524 RepID=UPI002FC8DF33
MNLIELELKDSIKKALKSTYDLDVEDNFVVIEMPKDPSFGDYSTNVAMRLAKELHQNPRVIAEALTKILLENNADVESCDVAGAGFINFRIKKSKIASVINTVLEQKDDYGKNDSGHNLAILVEYVSANPTGDLHLGHARGAAWGDCITRLLNASGYNCLREFYVNDAGVQITKLGESLLARYLQLFDIDATLPEDGYHGQDVADIAKIVKEEHGDEWVDAKGDETGRLAWFRKEGIRLELEKMKRDLDYFGVHFDSWISEQGLYDSGEVEKGLQKVIDMGLTYEEDGALWFKTTDYGDDKDRVLKKHDGTYTYLTPDIANHIDKFNRGYTKLVNLWGADHHGYVPRMKAALEALGYGKDGLEVDIIQMVRLVEDGKELKMSKRSGNAITIRELCDEVGVDASRYFFVSRAVDTHLDFDIGLAKKRSSDNPVYYAQYAHARMCSIIRQAPALKPVDSYHLLTDEKELALLKHINEFAGMIGDAAATRMPNKVCNYIQKLAQYFHSFYNTCHVLDDKNPELSNERLALLFATKITLKNALNLLGISAPETM